MSDDLGALRILRRQAVLDLTGISAATLSRWTNGGLFPRPVRLGPNSVGWRESAVREWLDSREPVEGASASTPHHERTEQEA